MGALLTQFMNRYGYTDFHELNADWLIKTLMEMINQVENFVSLNAIKYADPIQWNIVSQYEKNTVVIDPLTGTAYISVQPVPSGVALTRTEYWTVVFDLGSFVTRAAKNFSSRYEDETTLTATFATTAGDWLVWGDTLYEALVNITAGDQYVVDSNIKHITMEEVSDALAQAIQNVQNNVDALDTKVGDLSDLTTSVTTSVVLAINSVLNDLNLKIGDLTQLLTTDQTDVVSSINEVFTSLANLGLKSVKDYGAVGDGVTDDATAFQAAVDDLPYGSVLLIPTGTYILNSRVNIAAGKRILFIGENGNANGSNIKYSTAGAFLINDDGSSFYNLVFMPETVHPTTGTAIEVVNCYRMTIENCNFLDGFYGIDVHQGSEINIDKCSFMNFTPEGDGLAYMIKLGDTGYTAPVQIRDCLFRCLQGNENHGAIACDYVDGVVIQGCTINSCGFGVLIEPTGNHVSAYVFIDNCVMDSNLFHAVAYICKSGCRIMRSHVTNCWTGESGWNDININSLAADGYIEDIKIMGNNFAGASYGMNIGSNGDSVYDVIVADNVFQLIQNTGLQITGGLHIKVHDNIFNDMNIACTTDNYTVGEFYNNTEYNCVNLDNVGTRFRYGNIAGAAWRNYTPNISSGSGTITYTINHAKFRSDLDKITFSVKVTIDTATTASDLLVEMPRACNIDTMIPVKINNKAGTAFCSGGYATLVCYDATGDGTITAGDIFTIAGEYELKTGFDYQ